MQVMQLPFGRDGSDYECSRLFYIFAGRISWNLWCWVLRITVWPKRCHYWLDPRRCGSVYYVHFNLVCFKVLEKIQKQKTVNADRGEDSAVDCCARARTCCHDSGRRRGCIR